MLHLLLLSPTGSNLLTCQNTALAITRISHLRMAAVS